MSDERYSYWMERTARLEVMLKRTLEALRRADSEIGTVQIMDDTKVTIRDWFGWPDLIRELDQAIED